MKSVVFNGKYGKIEFNESFWTGKKEIIIDGKKLNKIAKNHYAYDTEESAKNVFLSGNYLAGTTIRIDGEEIELTSKAKWYEWILAFLSVLFVIVWGNSVELCKIFPIVGGFIGGAISGAISIGGLIFIKSTNNILYKILIALGTFVVAVLACFLVGLMIISAAA